MNYGKLDAEVLPFRDKTFDVSISGMVLGLVLDQQAMVNEMARVARPGGSVAISTYGPKYYWEAAEATFRAIPKGYSIGYRIEFWPRDESVIQRTLIEAGLVDVCTSRLTYQVSFESGAKAYDFFAATSAAWWNAKFPRGIVAELSQKVREYFNRHNVAQITDDIVLAYGKAP